MFLSFAAILQEFLTEEVRPVRVATQILLGKVMRKCRVDEVPTPVVA